MINLQDEIRRRIDQRARETINHAFANNTDTGTQHSSLSHAAPALRSAPVAMHIEAPPVSRRTGLLAASWTNPIVAAAMPALLLIARLPQQTSGVRQPMRAQLTLEIHAFRRKLRDAGLSDEDHEHVSYLLCTFADEALGPSSGSGSSLLVDFHGNAWGGEDCFNDLDDYMTAAQARRDILEFYHLVLSLGMEGKYRVVEHGRMLLGHLRDVLHEHLYAGQADAPLCSVAAVGVTQARATLTPWRLLIVGLGLWAMAFAAASWHLHEQALPVSNAILAWKPAARPPAVLDIQQTLPAEISALVAEGWLQVVKKPEGWLLLFTSDNAFASAQELLNPDYRHKIARMGQALAPWPGALEVVGHTDNQPIRRGRYRDNEALSLARAETVQGILKVSANTLQPNRLIGAVGRGDQDPIADNASEAGRRLNRRVDILWKVAAEDGRP